MNDDILIMEIESLLYDLGISAKLKGFYYIEESVCKIINENLKVVKIHYLYDLLASKYNTRSESIERAIRYAIGVGESKENYDTALNIFRNTLDDKNYKKTNKLFIMTLARYLKFHY